MSKAPKPLTPRLSTHLLAYVAAAGAVAACSSSASAEVVYTPAHRKIFGRVQIDLNHDGIDDFHVSSYYFSGIGHLSVRPSFTGNRIVSTPAPCGFGDHPNAAALNVGETIGPDLPFQADANCMAYAADGESYSGSWLFVKGKYLGFVFLIDGKPHFGWARLNMNYFAYNSLAELLGYAYETIPGKPIVAGDDGHAAQPPSGTLGELALGAKSVAKEKN